MRARLCGCGAPVLAKGLCARHYRLAYRERDQRRQKAWRKDHPKRYEPMPDALNVFTAALACAPRELGRYLLELQQQHKHGDALAAARV